METRASVLARLPSCLLFAAMLGTGVSLPLTAAPSGGPYGPVQQRYELPQAPHVYFVAPDAKPESSGASLDAPTTLETAIAHVVSGDAIVLRGGTYRTGGLVLNQQITMLPYADERPVLKGTAVARHWEALPNGRWRTTWTTLFPAEPADWWNAKAFVRETPLHLFNNDMVFIDGQLLGAVGREEDVTAATYYIDYANAQITIGTNPEQRLVEITAHDSALVRTFRPVHGKVNDHRGPTIRGITFTQYAYRALEVEGVEPSTYANPATFGKEVVGTTLDNDTISFCSRVAGYFRGDNLVIRHCLVSDCGTEGIYIINSADVLLEGNIITRTNSAEKFAGYYASAVKIFNQSYRPVCRDNLIIDNPNASGVWFDVGEVDAVFVNNWVERTDNGYFSEISKGGTCAGNVFVDCRPGTNVLNSSDVTVAQNTYVNSTAAFARNGRGATPNDHFGWHVTTGPDIDHRDGHVFVNNLLVADARLKDALVHFGQSQVPAGRMTRPQVSAMDGNVYVRQSSLPQPIITWSPTQHESNSLDFTTLEDFRRQDPKYAAHSLYLADYAGPVFHSLELRRFDLLPGFAGARTGIVLPTAIRTLLQLEADGAPFPGAYVPPR